MVRRVSPTLPLLGILLLALALRGWGLGWGLPSATHYFSYHPDESIVLGAAMRLNVFRGHMLPHFYRYGSLQLYLIYFANTLAFLFGSNTLLITDFATQHTAWAHQYLVGRGLTVAMGVGTVAVTYALGQRLWGRRAGLLAALILAITPLHAQHSHWLTVDVPATFWGILSLYWSVRLALGEPKPLRAALLAGIFAGLAAATKYNLALTLLPLALSVLFPFPSREGTGRLRPGLGLLGAGTAALAFLLACPGFFLDSHTFAHDFQAEADHVRFHPEAEFVNTGTGFVYHVTRNLDAGLGLPLLLLSLASVVYAVYRRERGDGLLASFALPYYVLIGLVAVRYARYVIPLLPILALWTGRLLADLSRLPHPVWRRAGLGMGAAVLAFTLADAAWLVQAMAEPDPRDQALAWLNAHAPAPTPIGFATLPWFDTPPVSPWFCAPLPGTWVRQEPARGDRRIVYPYRIAPDGSIIRDDWDASFLPRVPYVILTEYGYASALRLQDAAAAQFLGTLRGGPYVIGASFSRRGIDGVLRQDLPSDMTYPSPAIYIYQRK